MATDQQDVIQAQQKVQSEQQLLNQAKSALKADPTNANLQRTVTAREFNVTVYQQQLQEVLNEFLEDQGYSYFEMAQRQEAERQAQLEAERQRQLDAQRLAEEEADRLAEEEYQRQILAELQLEVERQAEADRQSELQRIAEEQERLRAEEEARQLVTTPTLDPDPNYGGFDPIEIPEQLPYQQEPVYEIPDTIFEQQPEPEPVYELPPMFEQQPEPEPVYDLPPMFEEQPQEPSPIFEMMPAKDPFSFLSLGKSKPKSSSKKSKRTEGLFTYESLTDYTERKQTRKKVQEEDPFGFYGFNQPKTKIVKGKAVKNDDPFAILSAGITPTRRTISKRSSVLKPEDIFRF